MNCLQVEEHFSAYLEDELDYQTVKAFEAHLISCERCHNELTSFRESINLLHQLPRVEPSPSFNTVLQIRLAGTQVERVPPRRRILEAIYAQPIWVMGGIATAMLVVLIGFYLYQDTFVKSPQNEIVLEANRRVDPLHSLPVPTIDVNHAEHLDKSPAAPDLNLQSSVKPPKFDETEVREEWQSPQMEQNYILQMVSYANTPTSGGL